MQSRPAFSDLPLNKGDPQLSAWGLWGKGDELGTLNFLTEEVVRAAASEIKDGVRINLNWSFGEPNPPCFGRQRYEHKVVCLVDWADFRLSRNCRDVLMMTFWCLTLK